MLTIGLPLVGDLPQECVTDLLVAAAQSTRLMERVVFICPQNVYPHDRARELIITEALKTESELLWFIDSDTRPPSDALFKLHDVLVRRKAVMVSGYYVQRGYPFGSTWSTVNPGCAGVQQDIPEEVDDLRIDGCGLGCALVDLQWIRENMNPPFFLMECDPSLETKYKWEDAFFCKKISDCGGEIWGHTKVVCKHMGQRGCITPESAGMLKRIEAEKLL
jgi:hypothetical protein